uniref:hypothetical protein n=1 Tax=Cohnella sp. GbtcB17 TaxID=2824762 RepID=UPI001C30B7F7
SNLMPRDGAIVINVNEEAAIGALNRSVASSPGSEWMVVVRDGAVVSHNVATRIMYNVPGVADVAVVMRASADRGHIATKK